MSTLLDELSQEFGKAHVFRPYRDVRFAKDKTPYKDHQGGFVGVEDAIGYYVQVSAAGLMVAGGWYSPQGQQINRFRGVVDGPAGGELERLVASYARKPYDPRGQLAQDPPSRLAARPPAHRAAAHARPHPLPRLRPRPTGWGLARRSQACARTGGPCARSSSGSRTTSVPARTRASRTGERLGRRPDETGAPRLGGRGSRGRCLRRLLRGDRRHVRALGAADLRAVRAGVHRWLAVRLHRRARGRRLPVVGRRDRHPARGTQHACTGSASPRCSALTTAARAAHRGPARHRRDDRHGPGPRGPQRRPRPARLGFWSTGLIVFTLWNLATLLGAVSVSAVGDPADWGLDAAVPAAFLALLWPRLTPGPPRVVAIGGAIVALALTPLVAPGHPGPRGRAGRRGGRAAADDGTKARGADRMTTTWAALLVMCAVCYALKLAGVSVPERVLDSPRVRAVALLLPGGPARRSDRRTDVLRRSGAWSSTHAPPGSQPPQWPCCSVRRSWSS